MSFMAGATCVMCGSGVHYKEGRVACDACDLPTDSCLCEATRARPRPPAGDLLGLPAPASAPAPMPAPAPVDKAGDDRGVADDDEPQAPKRRRRFRRSRRRRDPQRERIRRSQPEQK